ncbi:PREDICTED: uncharacterized protein LOC106116253 [Papilio xuthus]|uniref:Uncharacterized protein LOC106116253 n=1 Tax=Papilio xuthus TaxID=66420 RepID=A0AAJ7E705_PAPXU|nr:PREDICTED: uncharacterized protein LOC106116253 [Papilio xuthus]
MMILIIFIINVILKLSFANDTHNSAIEQRNHTVFKPTSYFTEMMSLYPQIPTKNVSYFEKSENLLRMPKKYYEDRKRKRKTIKKLPKRTVQKIIKKSKTKYRRNFNLATMQPTQVSNLIDKSFSVQANNEVTTQMNLRKKSRKNLKLMRYPMPFQKLPFHYRYKRENDRDVYILKDLDEIQFLSDEDGYDVVKAHVKNYW